MEPTLNLQEVIRKTPEAPQRWVPLLEFAHAKSVSLSTLRRYIKASKIQFKLDRGRYFILDTDPIPVGAGPVATPNTGAQHEETKRLQMELQQARKEIAELKMLVAFYEDKYTDGPNA